MKEVNLVEILKKCPIGYPLYSVSCGEVTLFEIDESKDYPIKLKIKGTDKFESVTKFGKLWIEYDGECSLFPSEDQRDWSNFRVGNYITGEFLSIIDIEGDEWISIYKSLVNGKHYTLVSLNLKTGKLYYNYPFLCSECYPVEANENERRLLLSRLLDDGKIWHESSKTLIELDPCMSDVVRTNLTRVLHKVKWKLRSILDNK